MSKPEPKLEPLACPHCGQAPTVHECDWSEPPTWSVICGCTGCTHETAAAAIAAWNTRTPPSEEEVERAARAIWATYPGSKRYPWEALGQVREDYRDRARAALKAAGTTPPSADVEAVRRAALEEAAKAVENMRPCPFDKGQIGPVPKPSEPCPICGDLGTVWSEQSNCNSPAAAIRALAQPAEETKP